MRGRDGVDRWYGQEMSDEQLERLKKYYNRTPHWDRPVWACGLHRFFGELQLGAFSSLPWGFGIWQDALSLQRGLIRQRLPFNWASVKTADGNV